MAKDILETVHETARGLHAAGVMTDAAFHELSALTKGEPMGKTVEQITEAVTGYLTGYASAMPGNLDHIAGYTDWPARAQQLLDQRAGKVLDLMDTETLKAIADGKVDVQAIASSLKK